MKDQCLSLSINQSPFKYSQTIVANPFGGSEQNRGIAVCGPHSVRSSLNLRLDLSSDIVPTIVAAAIPRAANVKMS
jgi:hypothetical protein